MTVHIVLDVLIEDEGTIALLTPVTRRAKRWCRASLEPNAQRFGLAYVVEHRFLGDIIEALWDADFNFQYSLKGQSHAN